MLGRLFMLFILVPMVELLLLIQLGQMVGLLPTLGLIVLTGAMGAMLARREGFRAFSRFSETMARGELPADAALDGLAILVGGAFLLTPGIMTDLVGFSLLLPPIRAGFKRRLVASARRRMEAGALRMQVYGFENWQNQGMWDAPQAGPDGGPPGPGADGDPHRYGPSHPGAQDPRSLDPREIVVPPPGQED